MAKLVIQRQAKKGQGGLDKLLAKMKEMAESSIETGYFKQQGEHSSGIMYTDLMKIHEYGLFDNTPERPVRELTLKENHQQDWKFIQSEIKNIFYKDYDVDYSFDQIGKYYTEKARDIFGNVNDLTPNAPSTVQLKGFNSPLVDSGDLAMHWSWRIGEDGRIKT